MGIQMVGDEEKLTEKIREHLLTGKNSCIITPICLWVQTGILCSRSVCIVSTFVSKRAIFSHEKWYEEVNS